MRNEWFGHITRIIHGLAAWHQSRIDSGMELIAFSAAQPPQQATDVSSELNSAGWGTLLWVTVIAVVFFVLLAAAGLSLIGGRRRTRE